MTLGGDLRAARQRAGLSQRDLARKTGVAQPTIARIELGHVEPRVGTLQRLLAACGAALEVHHVAGYGIDRTQFREQLRLTPRMRLDRLRSDAAGLDRLRRATLR